MPPKPSKVEVGSGRLNAFAWVRNAARLITILITVIMLNLFINSPFLNLLLNVITSYLSKSIILVIEYDDKVFKGFKKIKIKTGAL
jgi:hypothetical protein